MKITVLGCGAIGQLWLTALHRQNHQLQGWLRVEQPYCHVNLQVPSGEIENHTFVANDPAFLQDSALLLVTLKAWQVSDALRSLAPMIPETCPILLLHNGLGSAQELGFLNHPLLLGFTTQAAKRNGNLIEHVAYGTTHIGPSNPQASHLSYLADMLHQALPDVAWHDNIAPASWHKLAVNCVINPLSVLYNCTNGELLAYPEHIEALCHEIALVMNRQGYNANTEDLTRYVQQVMTATSQNTSSMLQDVREQRHTEIDYITGYLVRQAHQYGIPVPANSLLYEQIKWKENAYDRTSAGLSSPWE